MRQILPTALQGLEHPWNLTDYAATRRILTSQARAGDLLSILDNLLRAHLELQAMEPVLLPTPIEDTYNFLFHEYASEMPTLADITGAGLRRCLARFGLPDADPKVVATTLGDWLNHLILGQVILVRGLWLEAREDKGLVPDVESLLKLAGSFLPRIAGPLAEQLIALVTLVAWQRAVPLLQAVATNEAVDESVRNFASNHLDWVLTDSGDVS